MVDAHIAGPSRCGLFLATLAASLAACGGADVLTRCHAEADIDSEIDSPVRRSRLALQSAQVMPMRWRRYAAADER